MARPVQEVFKLVVTYARDTTKSFRVACKPPISTLLPEKKLRRCQEQLCGGFAAANIMPDDLLSTNKGSHVDLKGQKLSLKLRRGPIVEIECLDFVQDGFAFNFAALLLLARELSKRLDIGCIFLSYKTGKLDVYDVKGTHLASVDWAYPPLWMKQEGPGTVRNHMYEQLEVLLPCAHPSTHHHETPPTAISRTRSPLPYQRIPIIPLWQPKQQGFGQNNYNADSGHDDVNSQTDRLRERFDRNAGPAPAYGRPYRVPRHYAPYGHPAPYLHAPYVG